MGFHYVVICDDLPREFAMSDHHFWLSEEQFGRLQLLLPNKPRGVPRVDDRRVISEIIHVLKTGCRWRDAPAAYSPHKVLPPKVSGAHVEPSHFRTVSSKT